MLMKEIPNNKQISRTASAINARGQKLAKNAFDKIFSIMYSSHIFPITDLPRGLGLNFFSLFLTARL